MVLALSLVVVGLAVYLAPQVIRLWQVSRFRATCTRTRSLVLTYDDGPGVELTHRLLELLQQYQARATFFLLGIRVEKHPEIVDRIVAQGHEIGSHSYSHLHSWTNWPWKVVADIAAGYATLSRWIGPDALFRPPYGKVTLATWCSVRRRNAAMAWWTLDSEDTFPVLPSPRKVADAVVRAGGGVVLLHSFDRSAERTDFVLKTTELLLQTARAQGLHIIRLGDLMRLAGTNENA